MAASVSFKAGQSLYHEPGLNGAVRDRTNKKPVTPAVHEEEDLWFSSGDDDDDDDDYWTVDPMIKTNGDIRELEASISDPRDAGTADHWVQRSPSLVRLTGKHPFNSEPPLSRLMQVGFITPAPLHYVRNHGPVPRATWDGWRVEVMGLVRRPARFSMDQLVSEFPAREFPATLVCAGNRRKEQNMVKQTIGFNWGAAGVSTSVWRGVPLRCLLRRCGIMRRRDGAAFVCFEGAEELPGGGSDVSGGGSCRYATSVGREVAMDPGRDILVAYMQNGERLLPDHGFPVRIIIPGFIGGRMVKWLKRIVVTPQESDTHYHYKDNRVLPSHVDAELANAQAWWYKPEYIINELNVNSVITSPCHGEVLPANTWMTHQPYMLRGYAYSGGGRRVTRVEVTTNGGESWHVCRLDQPEKPNRFGKYWCWSFWWLELEVLGLLEAQEIAVRAWDESHNTQPEKLIWNVMGMMNNCWFRVKARVSKSPNGDIGIVFQHPTLPASQPGGWMIKSSESDDSALHTPKTTLPTVNNRTTVSLRELEKHDSPGSAWIAVNRKVYDCTRFLNDHPGGPDSILINAGTDCTEEFEAIHSDKAKRLLRGYLVGELLPESPPEKPGDGVISNGVTPGKHQAPSTAVALAAGEKIECKLVSKTAVSRDVRRFRFALPSEDQVLGLPVGKHIFLCATVRGKLCLRAYTPTTAVDQVGFFDLVVRIYFAGEDPKFPNGGVMSQYLDSLQVGSTVGVKGPLGHVEYAGGGVFTVHGRLKFARKLAMVAGGTGITPIYQVIQEVLRDPRDPTEMHLVYACRTEEDILLREELDGWAREAPGERLKVWYVVGRDAREGWRHGVGRVTEETLRGHVPAAATGVVALACGPPEMIESAVRPIFEKMNYAREALIVF